jgi:hypothetical protein
MIMKTPPKAGFFYTLCCVNLVAMLRKILPFACLLLVLVLIDCKNDPEPAPQEPSIKLTLIDSIQNIQVLNTLSLTLDASIPRGTKSASCQIWIDGVSIDTLFSALDSIYTIQEEVSFYIKPSYESSVITFTFALEDLFNNIIGDTITINIPESKIKIIDDQVLGTYGNFDFAGFYDIAKDTVFFGVSLGSTSIKKSIDFVYFFTKVEGGTLTSPSNDRAESTWITQIGGLWPLSGLENTTAFFELSSETNIDELHTAIELENLVKGKTALTELKPLQVGQVIGFQLGSNKSSKIGVLKIIEVAGNTISTATIKFDAKVAK